MRDQSDCLHYLHTPSSATLSLSVFLCPHTLLSFKQTGVEQNTPAILSVPSSVFATPPPVSPCPCKCQPSQPLLSKAPWSQQDPSEPDCSSHITQLHTERQRHDQKHLLFFFFFMKYGVVQLNKWIQKYVFRFGTFCSMMVLQYTQDGHCLYRHHDTPTQRVQMVTTKCILSHRVVCFWWYHSMLMS